MAAASVKDVQSKLSTHEAVCAERWRETIVRIKRLELVIITGVGSTLLLLAGMVWKMP